MIRKIIKSFICFVLVLLIANCASIVGSREETVTFTTNIEKANLKIRNAHNMLIYDGYAPVSLSLKKKESYFNGETYSIEVSKKGYDSVEMLLDTRLSAWYVLGNLIFGGLIGYLIVDPATGAMWTFEKENMFLNLTKIEQ